jgi:hypothetical protein
MPFNSWRNGARPRPGEVFGAAEAGTDAGGGR